ncbi:DUF6807 family protein [Microbacterium aurantiacum]|uniref:DUF6807 family protein n=1 Tax=Microbacterium aurantiacum TaxID=162393 RepID=UPI000C80ABD2|nr:DUF6807 family protein [Microbacterium aurantiacum]
MTFTLLRSPDGAVEYHDGVGLDRILSPRPYLTATTPGGVPVTEAFPDDHRHHLGVSLALPDVDGTSFWGGTTYRHDQGSVMLDNHGTQQVQEREFAPGAVTERIGWFSRSGEPLLAETRVITAGESAGTWQVHWTSELAAVRDEVTFGSPQTNGRGGAFYGGVFWRTPFRRAQVRTAGGDGTDTAHGSTAPWLQITGPEASLVAATSTGLPWFVRADGYVGFLPAVAVAERRVLARGETLRLDLAVAISGQPLDAPDDVAAHLIDGVRDAV